MSVSDYVLKFPWKTRETIYENISKEKKGVLSGIAVQQIISYISELIKT